VDLDPRLVSLLRLNYVSGGFIVNRLALIRQRTHTGRAGECRVYPKPGEGDAAAANATKDEVPKKNSLRIKDKVNSHSIFGKYQSRLPTKFCRLNSQARTP
jgi:hypothetical protein